MDRTVPAGAAMLLAFIYETETSKKPPECYEVIYRRAQRCCPNPLVACNCNCYLINKGMVSPSKPRCC